MLTPVDIQQKKFHIGLGYDKKDVNTFFEEVTECYEQLYRSNAELKEKVITLTDGLQNYKSKEASLRKSLMRAEKDSEDTKSRANREAKTIELEAKNKAKTIIGDAEERLAAIKDEMALLETQYAAYKSNFCTLMKQQYELLKEVDFDADSYIDEKALGVLIGASGSAGAGNSSGEQSFGSFNGDPQMRDESTLGGLNSNSDNVNSTSAVYTSHLGANENFVDPFNPNKDNGRYNPYDGNKSDVKSDSNSSKQSFKVADTKKDSANRYKRTGVKNAPESAPTPSVDSKSSDKTSVNSETEHNSKHKTEHVAEKMSDDIGPIPTVNFSINPTEDELELTGDVEVNADGKVLLGDGFVSDDNSADEFGFEFVED